VEESDHDMWHHCKGDTWHGLTWKVQLAWVDVAGTSGILTGLAGVRIIS
jgi:hypothetical protein